MGAEEDDSIGLTGAVTARVVGRRRVSKRLAFYDLRVEVTDADPTDVLARCTAAGPGATAASRHPDHAELCCKAGAGPLFVDEATLASAQRDALKLGNVVRVSGRWLAGKRGEPCVENVECLEVVERWAETNPGVVFQRDDANKSRAEDHGRKLADDESAPSPSPGTTNAGPTAGDDDKRELKPCKYWLNQGRCHKGDLCAYAHASRETQTAWISERKRRRRELAAEDGDPHAEGGGAKTKAKRAEVFVKWLVETFGVETLSKGSGVLDVAGGRGDVSFELHTKRKITCTLVEPRPRKLNKAQHKWLKTRNNNARRAICTRMVCWRTNARYGASTWGLWIRPCPAQPSPYSNYANRFGTCSRRTTGTSSRTAAWCWGCIRTKPRRASWTLPKSLASPSRWCRAACFQPCFPTGTN